MGDVINLKRPPGEPSGDIDWVAPWAAEIAQGILADPELCMAPEATTRIILAMERFAVMVADTLRPFDYDVFTSLMFKLFPERLMMEVRLCRAADWMPEHRAYFLQ